MNIYSDEEQQAIRDFFENTIPTFPFRIRAKPVAKVSVATIRNLIALCKDVDYFVPKAVFYFLRNLCADNFEQSANCFELEIMQTQGFMSMLYMYEAFHNRLEDTLTSYTWEYLRLKNEDNISHDEPAVDYMTVVPVVVIPPMLKQYDFDYDIAINKKWYVAIKQIEYADLHHVVVVTRDGDSSIISLSQLLGYDYKDFDADPYPDFDAQMDLSDVDPKVALDLIKTCGLQGFILPPDVYESNTKC
ncbi:hypothetical protein [Psychrobacter sp. FDAARGOS_221]|uniref:hypothetical protein n=1 Tax=Psychrobacter sp. FDAARGOS_221 TaxID=1975705 RepID=UPI000BB53718|nr:hypothetical protein [Psychrobacter sp. FDAARGOS_221]PNK59493.1 hypothetical protein A6J60_000390 [Psychrobacter sp. FDAARGOS_221]